MFWSTIFSLNCFYGHVEFTSINLPETSITGRNFSANCPTIMKFFNCFWNVFSSKLLLWICSMQFWQARQRFPAQIPEVIRQKVQKWCELPSKKNFSTKSSHGEVENRLKTPLKFYRQSTEVFPLEIQKTKQFVTFAKKILPKASFENENPFLTTPPRFSSQKL